MSIRSSLLFAAVLSVAPVAGASQSTAFAIRNLPVLGSVLTGGGAGTISGLVSLGGASQSVTLSRLLGALKDGPSIGLDLAASGLNVLGSLPGLSHLGTSHKGSSSLLPGLQSLPAGGVPAAILVGLPVTAGSVVTTGIRTVASQLAGRGR